MFLRDSRSETQIERLWGTCLSQQSLQRAFALFIPASESKGLLGTRGEAHCPLNRQPDTSLAHRLLLLYPWVLTNKKK